MSTPKRTFRIIQLLVNDITDLEAKEKLLHLYASLELAREEEVKTARASEKIFRDAQIVAASALAATAKATRLQTEFLEEAANVFPTVAQELQWVPFRNSDGNVVIESIFTRRDQRNVMRMEKAHMEAVASGATDFTKFFEKGEVKEDEGEERHVGFGTASGKPGENHE
jgi:hypothetical protein